GQPGERRPAFSREWDRLSQGCRKKDGSLVLFNEVRRTVIRHGLIPGPNSAPVPVPTKLRRSVLLPAQIVRTGLRAARKNRVACRSYRSAGGDPSSSVPDSVRRPNCPI